MIFAVWKFEFSHPKMFLKFHNFFWINQHFHDFLEHLNYLNFRAKIVTFKNQNFWTIAKFEFTRQSLFFNVQNFRENSCFLSLPGIKKFEFSRQNELFGLATLAFWRNRILRLNPKKRQIELKSWKVLWIAFVEQG